MCRTAWIMRSGPLQRFLTEYEVVSGIRHPNVVRIFDLGIADDMAFIVMEYFAGGHLGERLARGCRRARRWTTWRRSPGRCRPSTASASCTAT
jgi:serine/threonine protein kinase